MVVDRPALVASTAAFVALSWPKFTASVPAVPLATLVMRRCRVADPTETVLSAVATLPVPSAIDWRPLAVVLAPNATLPLPAAELLVPSATPAPPPNALALEPMTVAPEPECCALVPIMIEPVPPAAAPLPMAIDELAPVTPPLATDAPWPIAIEFAVPAAAAVPVLLTLKYVSSSAAIVPMVPIVPIAPEPVALHAPDASTVPLDPSTVVHISAAAALPMAAPPSAIAITACRAARDEPFECDFAVSATAVHVRVAAFQMLR